MVRRHLEGFGLHVHSIGCQGGRTCGGRGRHGRQHGNRVWQDRLQEVACEVRLDGSDARALAKDRALDCRKGQRASATPMVTPVHFLFPQRHGPDLQNVRGGEAVLSLHRSWSFVSGDAPRASDSLYDDEMASGRIQRAAGGTDDGRRKVLVEGELGSRERGRPHEVPAIHDRKRQGHHRGRLRQKENIHIFGLRVRRAHVSKHCADLEGHHIQLRQGLFRIPA
mmetsp:Transcript_109323/g.308517  ORF Transcript_109323/g.308517 Transcript_109323/m.308517 type:complete len:224 (+) Transcript_109323:414-1085(+)